MTKKKRSKVYLLHPNSDLYATMFANVGIEVVESIAKADFIQFTGGQDITPKLYGQRLMAGTFPNRARDRYEVFLYSLLRKDKIPMAGICRGGQLLHAMLGGDLWQSVSQHQQPHSVFSIRDNKMFTASSQHHQMMTNPPLVTEAGARPEVLLLANTATEKKRTSRVTGLPLKLIRNPITTPIAIKEGEDIEAIAYPDQRVLCVQGHPEHSGYGIFKEWYMENLSRYLGVNYRGQ